MNEKIIHVYAGLAIPALSGVLIDHNTNQSAILQAANKPGEFILGKGGFHFLMIDDSVELERRKFLSIKSNYPDSTIVISCVSTKSETLLALGYISTSHRTFDVREGELWSTTNRSKHLPMGLERRICY
ncbi:hypothetical protein TOTORO_01390 [Serratia phage vB_SmaS-Totoro]|nr:hypothetical protein TOTORO_01390 [Serratia phage vB_SmaS-Totoro]